MLEFFFKISVHAIFYDMYNYLILRNPTPFKYIRAERSPNQPCSSKEFWQNIDISFVRLLVITESFFVKRINYYVYYVLKKSTMFTLLSL